MILKLVVYAELNQVGGWIMLPSVGNAVACNSGDRFSAKIHELIFSFYQPVLSQSEFDTAADRPARIGQAFCRVGGQWRTESVTPSLRFA